MLNNNFILLEDFIVSLFPNILYACRNWLLVLLQSVENSLSAVIKFLYDFCVLCSKFVPLFLCTDCFEVFFNYVQILKYYFHFLTQKYEFPNHLSELVLPYNFFFTSFSLFISFFLWIERPIYILIVKKYSLRS